MQQLLYLLKDYLLLLLWYVQGSSPSLPPTLKRKFLVAHAPASYDWIETGTYRGFTTRYLAQHFPLSRVVTIEPSLMLHEQAKLALAGYKNITLLHGDSAEVLDKAIALVGNNVGFFLDGHYSGGDTFQGHSPCPIPSELEHIKKHTADKNVVIMIDDARLFHEALKTGYPTVQAVIQWADENHYSFEEKSDIFILRKQTIN